MSSVTERKSKSHQTKNVKKVFYDSQFTKNHASSLTEMKKLYNGSELDDFLVDFIHCLKVCFTHPEASALVQNALDFAAKFAVSLSNNLDDDNICPFLDNILQFLFNSHHCEDHNVRFRVCHFLNRLLDNMGRDATLEEEICNNIKSCMMERLQDKLPKVRAEAVYALYRLQDPSNPSCQITSVFLNHMSCDPSHKVRCAIATKIAVNKKTLPFVFNRIHDVKDVVRRAAYSAISKLTVQRLTIRQRQTILENGLRDNFKMVRDFVASRVLPAWLDAYNSNYLEFMQSINVEYFTDVCITALKILFKNQRTVPVASMGIEDKLIPYSILSSERVVFWRALAEYLKEMADTTEEYTKHFENVLPDLTPFVQYIRYYFFPLNRAAAEYMATEFVLVQLLQMTKMYDLSDEAGRSSLKELSMALLLSSRVGPIVTKVIAELFLYIFPDKNVRLSFMVEIVSELREPLSPLNATFIDEGDALRAQIAALEFDLFNMTLAKYDEEGAIEHLAKMNQTRFYIKELERERDKLQKPTIETNDVGRNSTNDNKTLIKCLTLITSVIEAEDITEINPVLHSLLQNFILPMFENENEDVKTIHQQQLTVQALGIFCILDLQLARDKFLVFCFLIANEFLSETALKVVFDLLYFHGLDAFSIEEPQGDFMENELVEGTTRQKRNLIFLLVSLLNSQVPSIKITTLQGLCKLIYSKRVCNPYLLICLFVLWFNPETENDAQVRQSLEVFFNLYATNCPSAPGMLSDCFIPTLKAFSSNKCTEIADKVDINNVAKLLVSLTRPDINRHDKNNNKHNLLAINICNEILEGTSDVNLDTTLMVKTLSCLDLNYAFQEDIEIITKDVKTIKMLLKKGKDEVCVKILSKMEVIMEGRKQLAANGSVSTGQNTLPGNGTVSTTTDSNHKQLNKVKLIMEKENDSFSSSDESSYIESPRVVPDLNGEEIIIPETSDTESS